MKFNKVNLGKGQRVMAEPIEPHKMMEDLQAMNPVIRKQKKCVDNPLDIPKTVFIKQDLD